MRLTSARSRSYQRMRPRRSIPRAPRPALLRSENVRIGMGTISKCSPVVFRPVTWGDWDQSFNVTWQIVGLTFELEDCCSITACGFATEASLTDRGIF